MISIYEWAALGAAFSWSIGSVISMITVRHMGSLAFNRYRLWISFSMLLVVTLVLGLWRAFPWDQSYVILVSGFVGIFMGDTALFACVRRLGARRSSVLFSMNAPMTAVLGFVLLGESLAFLQSLGIVVAVIGVWLAIIFGKRKSQISAWEDITPPLWLGVILGLLAALGQSIGSIIIRPVMETGADPVVVAMLRVGISAVALTMFAMAAPQATKLQNPMNKRMWIYLAGSAFVGMGLGMTLIMFAFRGAEAGIAATLSSTTPVMVLPILWFTSKEAPALGAWFGAGLVVAGSAMIFLG